MITIFSVGIKQSKQAQIDVYFGTLQHANNTIGNKVNELHGGRKKLPLFRVIKLNANQINLFDEPNRSVSFNVITHVSRIGNAFAISICKVKIHLE